MKIPAISALIAWMMVICPVQQIMGVKFNTSGAQAPGSYYTNITECPMCPVGEYNRGCTGLNPGTCAPCLPPAIGNYFTTPPTGQPRVSASCPQAEKKCTCQNGQGSVGVACPEHNTSHCASCKAFYEPKGSACVEKDSDGDGTTDISDQCPLDPKKTAPGVCNCSTPDTDSDRDGAADCVDGCPNDPAKRAPGTCGCGVPDADGDGDGVMNCWDGCPQDANKTTPGACGCGTADTDTDSDATPDCQDRCMHDALKTAPGTCGCGVPDVDSDNDSALDCNDDCPNDPTKIGRGHCDCGTADTDSDNDGTPDCRDQCPADATKRQPGTCGCGTEDADTDGDGTPDCNDRCPNDRQKTAAGSCGCGVSDVDTDSDGTPNCNDACPADASKTAAGLCGCGVADNDTDGDGTPDCTDACAFDASKIAPGTCGCGVAENDSDGDGTLDCVDGCPNSDIKTAPGVCGCSTTDADTDGDSTADCNDGCPSDAAKTEAGKCGCGVADADTDGDGTPDCNDGCATDSKKTTAGVCGCGTADTDTDSDGTPDCNEKNSIEVGTFAMTTGAVWETITFQGSFSSVPVVAVMPTTDGSNPVTIYIKDVTTTGFKAAPAEPYNKDGPHPAWSPENITYIAVEPGTHSLGGKIIQAGTKSTMKQKYNDGTTTVSGLTGSGEWDSITFSAFPSSPALLTQIQTVNNNANFVPASSYASPFLVVACESVTTSGASVALERAEVANYGAVSTAESIGWIAIETGTGKFTSASGTNVTYASLYTARLFEGWGTSKSVDFGITLGTSPLVIASKDTRHGDDGGWLRLRSRSSSSVTLVVDEDDKVDSERDHVTERAGIFAVSSSFYMQR